VKACDYSSVGGFKTTTINILHTLVDQNGVEFFPQHHQLIDHGHYLTNIVMM